MKFSDCAPARRCWLCGGTAEPLDRHHIFGGANRKKSEQYGAVVDLCHGTCHIFGAGAVHNNAETMEQLHKYGQRMVMREQGWDVDEFRAEFGKNYLDPEELDAIEAELAE